jgi:hypothetical protein
MVNKPGMPFIIDTVGRKFQRNLKVQNNINIKYDRMSHIKKHFKKFCNPIPTRSATNKLKCLFINNKVEIEYL